MSTISNSRRTTILIGLLVGCLAVAGLGETVWGFVTQPLNERQTKLNALRQTIDQQQAKFLAIRTAEAKHREWQNRTLPADASQATTRYQHWLADQLRELQLDRAVMTPGAALVRGDHFWVPVQIETEASPATFASLLARLEESSVLQRVRRVQVQAAGLGNREQLKISLQVEALALTGRLQSTRAQESDPFVQATPPSADSAPLSELLARRNPFALVGPQASIAMAEEASPTEAPVAAEPESLTEPVAPPELKLVAILVQPDKRLAWLYDPTTQNQHALSERKIAILPTGEIEVLAIQPSFVELRAQRQQFRLMLGETLAMPAEQFDQTVSATPVALTGR